MIKSVSIENYKCYQKSVLNLKDLAIIVGSNNAGKSTLIEALRLISYAAGKYTSINYSDLPTGFGLPKMQKGFRINTNNLMIDLKCAIYQFEDKIAKIDVTFDTKEHIIIYLNAEEAYACVKDSKGEFVTTKAKARTVHISSVKILPQIGLIKDSEKRITDGTIEKSLGTRLSSRHFRNELLLFKDKYYNTFVDMAQNTWDGLRVQSLEAGYGADPISLIVYDGSFSAEIGDMGSGLQMWLQIIWFLSQCDPGDTIILDEPDVYMHPDMQRKIFSIVVSSFKQIIIATHSVEIISKVDPHNIISIDRSSRRFSYANNLNGAQSIINEIGGTQNLSLLRLGAAKKCVFVEGGDITLLSKIYDKLYPDRFFDFNSLPIIRLGGKGRFEESFGTAKLFYEETKGSVQTICILDHDYSPDEDINNYIIRAKQNHLDLCIWKKKELENYLITPEIVFSACKLQESERQRLYRTLSTVADGYKDDVQDAYLQRLSEINKRNGKALATLNKEAREIVGAKWSDLEGKMGLINGKELMKSIKKAIKEEFEISLRQNDFLEAITLDNISSDVTDVLRMITE